MMNEFNQAHSVVFLFQVFKHESCNGVDNATKSLKKLTAFLNVVILDTLDIFLQKVISNIFDRAPNCFCPLKEFSGNCVLSGAIHFHKR